MAERSRRMLGLRRLGCALLVASATVGLGACSARDSGDDCGSGAVCGILGTTTVPPVDIQLRPVLSATPASIGDNPCPSDLPAAFQADQIQISGDFTEASATALAAGIEAAG